jgi:hypothetical protein
MSFQLIEGLICKQFGLLFAMNKSRTSCARASLLATNLYSRETFILVNQDNSIATHFCSIGLPFVTLM